MLPFDPSARQVFPAKLLLFGEYSVLLGSQALALPLKKFSGSFFFAPKSRNDPRFLDWCAFLGTLDFQQFDLHFNWDQMKTDLQKGLHFKTNIPIGYGLGSSGVLCAAVLWRYSNISEQIQGHNELLKYKNILAEVESFFHNKSSGLDPLVSLYNQPILVRDSEQIEVTPSDYIHVGLNNFYLYDSQQGRSTAEWVRLFHHKMERDLNFVNASQKMVAIQNSCIESWLSGDTTQLKKSIFELSLLQFQEMAEWIPESVYTFWEKGLSDGSYALKLCGAGGGGYFLVYRMQDQSAPLSGCLILE